MNTITFHDIAIYKLIVHNNYIKSGARKSILKYMEEFNDFDDDDKEEFPKFEFVPDAWKFHISKFPPEEAKNFNFIVPFKNRNAPTFILAEVEDTSSINTEKLKKLFNIWYIFEDFDCYINIFLFNKFGDFIFALEETFFYKYSYVQWTKGKKFNHQFDIKHVIKR